MYPDLPDDQRPMTAEQKAGQARPKWSSGLESKLALMGSMVTMHDYTVVPTFMIFSGGGKKSIVYV